MTVPHDVPDPWAALIIVVLAVALTYLMCVDWTHPNTPEK